MEKLLDLLKSFAGFLFYHYKGLYNELNKARNHVPLRYMISDFVSVLRSCGMFVTLHIVALLVFTVLPQGRDVLLIVVEEIAVQHHVGNLLWLLGGAFIWSVVSEYGSRYAIYVTDHSGKSLSDERVQWRKAVQKTIAQTSLLMPYFILLLGFVINYIGENTLTANQRNWGFGIPMGCMLLLVNLVARAYFLDDKKEGPDEIIMDPKSGELVSKKPSGIMSFMRLPRQEMEWCNKLIGIYNDYVFQLRKPSNFSDNINGRYEDFTEQFLNLSRAEQSEFLKDPGKMPPETIIPASFVPFPTGLIQDDKPDSMYRWIYRIPLKFYKQLHLQLKIIALTSLSIFLIVSVLPIRYYEKIGAPGLVIFAFACWIGIYVGLLYVDYALLRRKPFSLRITLVVVLILSSLLNNDHPVRYDSESNYDRRPVMSTHFDNWFEQYKAEGDHRYFFSWVRDTAGRPIPKYPVVFVCAEGGALRTGAFTSLMLSFLQESLANAQDSVYKKLHPDTLKGADIIQPVVSHPFNFKRAIYAYSGVSGGSLGIAFFNAMAYLTPDSLHKVDSLTNMTDLFFQQDYLSPVIGKMFYGDLINLFLPFQIPVFDRAAALEKGWESGYRRVVTADASNIFSDNFQKLYSSRNTLPALFINTTEVETGLQCWMTNVRPDSTMLLSQRRDLFNKKIRGGIRYSTVVNFSTRFPLFSPGGNLKQDDETKYHYVDGGYVENTGTATMLEILQTLKLKSKAFRNGEVVPFVFVLNFSDSREADTKNLSFGNELSEILAGIYDTRAGRSAMAMDELRHYTEDELHGKVIQLCIGKSGSQVPLNWVLSTNSLNNLKMDIKDKWEHREFNDLRNLYILNKDVKWDY